VEAEGGFEPLARNPFHAVVHPPVTASAENADSIAADHQERRRSVLFDPAEARCIHLCFQGRNDYSVARQPAVKRVERRIAVQVVRRSEINAKLFSGGRIHAQFVREFPNTEPDPLPVGTDPVFIDCQLQRVEFLRPIAVGPP